ncbi:phosphomannomutase/phosphoglucomutase [Oscillospiraceae bacterium PP1C4]
MSISRESIMKLQNGSDVRGIATEGIEGQQINLTGEAVNLISIAFVEWLAAKKQKPAGELKIGVGHDSRISAPELKSQVLQGIVSQGAAAFDCGLASTPSMFMSVVFPETQYDGSIMITASHLPFNRNGLKFFDAQGGLEHEDITSLLTTAAGFEAASADVSKVAQIDLISMYAQSLCEKIRQGVKADDYEHPLAGLKVAVDAGNGAGGFFVEKVLSPLGADTTGSQFLEPDGMFPNHIPNPENKAAMDAICKATVDSGADLGIIFDTDVDRMSAVLSDGTEVNRDAIIAMMAAILSKDYPNTTIVTDSVTSDKLTDFLENTLKMKHHRFKRGYKNVINEAKRLNEQGIETPLAIETSGHGALKENYFLDDGAYLAVKLLIAAANAKKEDKQIDALIAQLPAQFECREYRMNIMLEDFKAYGKEILAKFEERAAAAGYAVAPNSYEGIRLSFTGEEVQGWLLLRMSLHDPLLPLNLEGNRPGDCDRILKIAKELLAGFDKLDMTPLNQ